FDDMALLVDLDGIDAGVVALVFELLHGGAEGFLKLAHAMAKDIGEAEKDGELDAASLELIDEVLEVDGLVAELVGVNGDVSLVVDSEVAFSPMTHPIGFDSILDVPLVDQVAFETRHQWSLLSPGRGDIPDDSLPFCSRSSGTTC